MPPPKKRKPTRKQGQQQQQLPKSTKSVLNNSIPNLSPPSLRQKQQPTTTTTSEFQLFNKRSKYSSIFNSQESTPGKFANSNVDTKKRPQSHHIESNGNKKKKKQWSTPVQHLQNELNLLGNDDEEDDETIEFKYTIDKPKPTSSSDFLENVTHEMVTLNDDESRKSINKRRQSYNNRGKRASSIGNGFVTDLHPDIPVTNYYKHLNNSLPGPDRLRQLLVWCMKKRLNQEDKRRESINTDNQTNINIAKVIEEETVKALMEKKISTNWYDREHDLDEVYRAPKVMLENFQNTTNLANIKLYKPKLSKIRKEKLQCRDIFTKDIKFIKNTSIGTSDTKKQSLEEYSKTNHIGTSVLEKVTENYTQASQIVNSDLQYYMDNRNYTVRTLEKDVLIAKTIQDNHVTNQVSDYLHNYFYKNNIENYQILKDQEDKSVIRWPYPTTPFDTKDLLLSLSILQTSEQD